MNESGYSKNVSLARLKSHDVFVKDFGQWLQAADRGEQDVVLSAYPLIATNLLLGKHKERLGYKLIIRCARRAGRNRFPPFCPC